MGGWGSNSFRGIPTRDFIFPCVYYEKSLRQACVHFVSISRQKIRKNIKTNETKQKDKIMCFQSLVAQLLDNK